MNTLDMLCNKLKLIVRYCSEKRTGMAIFGMSDIIKALAAAIEAVMAHELSTPENKHDTGALLEAFQAALDAAGKKDTGMLGTVLQKGILPELEHARLYGFEISITPADTDRKAEERIISAFSPVIVCLFGYGDGQYYEELCRRAPEGSSFIVFEPETDSFADLQKELANSVDYYGLERVVVLATPGYDTIFCSEYVRFVNTINDNRTRLLVNLDVLKRFKEDASRNVISNLHILEKCNFVSSLQDILPHDVPVIIVSAGPSLDKNIDLLGKAKGHSLIFAVDTALKYLMDRDIIPDLAITVEPVKPMVNYEDDRCFDVPHIFDLESNRAIVSKERSRILIYNCRDYLERLLIKSGIPVPPQIPNGGSVATAAFAICCGLNMKNIILIGQDLAYSGTATHAGKVESAGLSGDIGTDMVEGIDGGQVRTRSDWQGYRFWFENMIRQINERHQDINIIDATEGGALIHGSRVMTLSDAIEKYCAGCDFCFEQELKKLPYMLDENKYHEVCAGINKSFDELTSVKDAALKGAKLCESVSDADEAAGNDDVKDEALPKEHGSDCKNGSEGFYVRLAEYRRICESALMYPLINNYTVSDVAEKMKRLRREEGDAVSEIQRQKLTFEAIAGACDYFAALRPASM